MSAVEPSTVKAAFAAERPNSAETFPAVEDISPTFAVRLSTVVDQETFVPSVIKSFPALFA